MAVLAESRIVSLLQPYLGTFPVPEALAAQLSVYLELLLKWNARMNLTAIRDAEQIVCRHFGESLFAGVHLAAKIPRDGSLLDLGSGAGFPGLPIQLLLPSLRVTLAESQNKKATFLREAVRTLGLSTRVHAARAEDLTADESFDAVTLRAVDNMAVAMAAARVRVATGGWLAVLTAEGMPASEMWPLPNSEHGSVVLLQL